MGILRLSLRADDEKNNCENKTWANNKKENAIEYTSLQNYCSMSNIYIYYFYTRIPQYTSACAVSTVNATGVYRKILSFLCLSDKTVMVVCIVRYVNVLCNGFVTPSSVIN